MKDLIRMNQLAGIISESQARKMTEVLEEENLQEGYKFNDANEDTAEEIKSKLEPIIKETLKKAMIDVATKNPELKGAANYGLAAGLIAYDIVMKEA